MSWTKIVQNPGEKDFYDLFFDKCAAISVKDFLNSGELEMVANAVKKFGLDYYDYRFDDDDVPKAKHIFDTHYLYEEKKPEEYFPKAKKNNEEYRRFAQAVGFDPALRVAEYMSELIHNPVTIAKQDGNEYTYAMVRELSSSALLHADYAKFIPDYWHIHNIQAEYAWNIYITDPGEGGETKIYNKLWEKEDDKHVLGETYGYHDDVVKGTKKVSIKPKAGAVDFFQ